MKNSLITGVYNGLSNDEYHNDAAIGSSTLKAVASKSPAHALRGSSISSKAADYGTAFHMAILEPERFEVDVICGPEDRRGNRWKDAHVEAGAKTLLVQGDYDLCCEARDSLHASETIRGLIAKKKAVEQSVFWRDNETGLMLKARPDLVTTDCLLVDLKTTVCAKKEAFERDAFKYGYGIQEAHYLEGIHNVEFEAYTFLFLSVEKSAPFGWSIFEYDDASKAQSKKTWREALNKWAECKKQNAYPSYPEYQVMSLPNWAMPSLSMFEEDETEI